MPHVSKQHLKENKKSELINQLFTFLSSVQTAKASKVYGSLLTDTEQLMVAKRLAAILMFSKGYSSYRVWNTLKISPSTAERLRLQYETGRHKEIILCLKNTNYKKLLTTIEFLLQAGMPPQGKGRWRSVLKK